MNATHLATVLRPRGPRFCSTGGRLIAALFVALGFVSSTPAQSGSRPAGEAILPPVPTPMEAATTQPTDLGGAPTTIVGDPLAPIDMTHGYSCDPVLDFNTPALTESSGTWLRRGWWYTRIDAVAMVRRWDRSGVTLAIDPTPTLSPPSLRLGRSSPGREGSARLTLGRFLFRDKDNRDHTAEFTFFGGNEFAQNETLVATTAGGLFVPTALDQALTVSFDGATSSRVSYASRFNSFEFNYVLTSRPGRDRMELQPNGEWVRRMNTNGITYHGTAGLRLMHIAELLDWTANNPGDVAGAATGLYDIDTDNYLFGPQFGGGLTREWDRASLTMSGMLGGLANSVRSRERLVFTDAGGNDAGSGFVTSDDEDSLSFLLQFGVTGRWHMRPNVTLRAGYEMLFVTAVAQAPGQLNFEQVDGDIAVTGDNFYHGISIGVEGYW